MGASAHEIVMESRQEKVDKLIAQMEKGYASTKQDVHTIQNRRLSITVSTDFGLCLQHWSMDMKIHVG